MLSVAVVTGYPVMVTGYHKTITFFFSKFLAVTGHPFMVTDYYKIVANCFKIHTAVADYPHMVTDYPSRADPKT